MVRYNWEEEILLDFGIKKPKTFKRETKKQIEENTLDYIRKFGKSNWVPVSQIFRDTLKETDLFNSKGGNFYFAAQGIKSKIHSTTLKLRKDGHPIISGKGHKGYRYADEDCYDFIDRWNEVFSANIRRAENLTKEYEILVKLAEKIIERLLEKKRKEEAKQLQKILIKYSNKNKELEND